MSFWTCFLSSLLYSWFWTSGKALTTSAFYHVWDFLLISLILLGHQVTYCSLPTVLYVSPLWLAILYIMMCILFKIILGVDTLRIKVHVIFIALPVWILRFPSPALHPRSQQLERHKELAPIKNPQCEKFYKLNPSNSTRWSKTTALSSPTALQ